MATSSSLILGNAAASHGVNMTLPTLSRWAMSPLKLTKSKLTVDHNDLGYASPFFAFRTSLKNDSTDG